MTADHPVRRLLARVCSADTMARVVDPTLADMRVEDGGLSWRGALALARALTLHALLSIPNAARAVVVDDDHAVLKVGAISMGSSAIVVLLLIAWPIGRAMLNPHAGPMWWITTLLLPQALAVVLPATLLVAIPVAIRRVRASARLVCRLLLVCALYTAVMFAIVAWLVPASNQAFRVATSGIANLPRGINETSLALLRAQIAWQRGFPGSESIVRRLEYAYEMRLALSAAAIPIGLLALASGFSPLGRRRPLVVGGGTLVLYMLTIFAAYGSASAGAVQHTAIAAGSFAWLPNAVIVFAAGAVYAGWCGRAREAVP